MMKYLVLGLDRKTQLLKSVNQQSQGLIPVTEIRLSAMGKMN